MIPRPARPVLPPEDGAPAGAPMHPTTREEGQTVPQTPTTDPDEDD
jgi:hypothetical protein